MTVMNDRSQGGSLNTDGSIEIMVDRILPVESEVETLFDNELWISHFVTFTQGEKASIL
jgi:hypothetical protein